MGTDSCKKTFTALSGDIACEIKNINAPINSNPIFHSHDGYEMVLVLDGEMAFYIEGDARALSRGDLALINELEFHRGNLIRRRVYNRIVINFRKKVISELSSEKSDLLQCFNNREDGKLNVVHLDEDGIMKITEIAERLRDSLQDKGFGSDVLAEAALTEILVFVNRMGKKDRANENDMMTPLIRNLFSYIDEHISEDLSLKTLEEQLKYNGTYLSRCFKNTVGTSLQHYIIAKRLSVAQKLLQEGNTPYNVCFLSGFCNYSNFSRTFQKEIGKSPREYQNEVFKGKKV